MDSATLRKVAQEINDLDSAMDSVGETLPGLGSLDLHSVNRLLSLMGTISEAADKHGLNLNDNTLISLAQSSYLAQLAIACDSVEDGVAQSLEELVTTLREAGR